MFLSIRFNYNNVLFLFYLHVCCILHASLHHGFQNCSSTLLNAQLKNNLNNANKKICFTCQQQEVIPSVKKNLIYTQDIG